MGNKITKRGKELQLTLVMRWFLLTVQTETAG